MARGRWIAARLSDGGGDNTLYDSRDDAVRAQLHSRYHAYVRIAPSGMSPRAALVFLRMARQIYERHSMRLDLPGIYPILPQRSELRRALLQWGTR